MTKKAFRGLFFCALLGAVAFRTLRLDLRPMHADEANQAVKFGDLLERGDYRFDPKDHHGPTLYYLTLPAARAAGATTLAGLDERVLRLVPAVCGAALLAPLPSLLRRALPGGDARGGRAGRRLAGADLLQPLLHPGDPARLFPRGSHRRGLALREEALGVVGHRRRGRGRPDVRDEGNEPRPLRRARGGLRAPVARRSASGLIIAGSSRPGAGGSGGIPGPRLPSAFHAALFLAAGAVTAALLYTSFSPEPPGTGRFDPGHRRVVRPRRPPRRPRPSLVLLFPDAGLFEAGGRPGLERGLRPLPRRGRRHRRPGPRRGPGRQSALPPLHPLLHRRHRGRLQPHPVQDALEHASLLSRPRHPGRQRRRAPAEGQPLQAGQGPHPGHPRAGLRRSGPAGLPGEFPVAGGPRESLRLRSDEPRSPEARRGSGEGGRGRAGKTGRCWSRSSPRPRRPGPCPGISGDSDGSATGRVRRRRGGTSSPARRPWSSPPPLSPTRSPPRSGKRIRSDRSTASARRSSCALFVRRGP